MKYTVEYSVQQKCFHIDSIKYTLDKNAKNTIEGEYPNDYKIIAIVDSYEEATVFIEKIKRKMLK